MGTLSGDARVGGAKLPHLPRQRCTCISVDDGISCWHARQQTSRGVLPGPATRVVRLRDMARASEDVRDLGATLSLSRQLVRHSRAGV